MRKIELKTDAMILGREKVLDKIELTVTRNSIVGILGPNGSGKSTLLNILGRQFGVCSSMPNNLKIGWARTPGVFFEKIPLEKFVLKVLGPMLNMEKKNIQTRMDFLARVLSIKEILAKCPSMYSAGNRMKAAILLAFLDPDNDLILLDEPFNGLDLKTIDCLTDLIHRETEISNAGVIISGHQVDLFEGLITSAVFLKSGKIVSQEHKKEFSIKGSLKDHYRELYKSGS